MGSENVENRDFLLLPRTVAKGLRMPLNLAMAGGYQL